MTSSIGFIGLGIMGLPMAVNLAKAGFTVHAHSRTSTTRERAASRGLDVVGSISDAVSGADVVVTMLPDTPDVEAVLLGDSGVFGSARAGATVIDMSTIDPTVTERLHHEASHRGLRFLDAPVSGGQAGAEAAKLSIMVGGEPDTFEAAHPVFEALGTTVALVGGPGAGQTVKAANQVIVAGNIQVLSEALTLLRKQGADLPRAMDVLGGGLAGSAVLTQKRDGLLSDSFEPGFRLELHHKDLGIAQQTARAAGVAMPVAALVTQLVQAMISRGDGQLDHSALYRLVGELNGDPA